MDIDKLINDLIQREGGYVNNPADRGGPTNFGITEQRARAAGYQGDMRNFPIELARTIYLHDYWVGPGFASVSVYFPVLAEELFDYGVNSGPKAASKDLQRVLNVLNRQHTDYPDIIADGDIGPMTFSALINFKAKRPQGETVLLIGLKGLRVAKYIAIAEANPSQETFEYGWLNRVGDI